MPLISLLLLISFYYQQNIIHDIMESWLVHRQKKLDFEMAKKIPVPAVLSFWSIKGIAIPLSSHAKKFLFLNRANAYFSKRSDFTDISKPFQKPVNSQLGLANFLKNTNANYRIATQESKCFKYWQLLFISQGITDMVAGSLAVESHVFLQNMHYLVS